MAPPPTPVPRAFPFSPGGAAQEVRLTPGASDPIVLSDLTALPRFGLKGPGSADWLAGQGLDLPRINRIGQVGGLRLLRLGTENFVLLADSDGPAIERLAGAWTADEGTRGYPSWCEEGWAWIRLFGPRLQEAMAKLCAVDLRPGRFGSEDVAQTRVAQIEAVIFRSHAIDGPAFDILFEMTASAFFARAVHEAAREFTGDRGEREDSACPVIRS